MVVKGTRWNGTLSVKEIRSLFKQFSAACIMTSPLLFIVFIKMLDWLQTHRTYSFCGTIEYMAPEIIKSNVGHDFVSSSCRLLFSTGGGKNLLTVAYQVFESIYNTERKIIALLLMSYILQGKANIRSIPHNRWESVNENDRLEIFVPLESCTRVMRVSSVSRPFSGDFCFVF